MISELIDKQDNFEVIRDQIAFILVSEIANQMALATAAEKDPEDWRLKVYTERSNPWELFSDVKCSDPVPPPIVNIWYDNSSFDQKAGNVVFRQKSDTVYNIDCYGYGRSSDDGGTGHTAGDKSAALAVQKAIRLVRNILMAAEYTYLDLRGTVWQRWPQSITVFQPQIDSRTVQNIVGARVALRVGFNEFSPQINGEELELLSISVTRAEDGEIYLEADYEAETSDYIIDTFVTSIIGESEGGQSQLRLFYTDDDFALVALTRYAIGKRFGLDSDEALIFTVDSRTLGTDGGTKFLDIFFTGTLTEIPATMSYDASIDPALDLVTNWKNFNIEGEDPSFDKLDAGYNDAVFVDAGQKLQLPANFAGDNIVLYSFDYNAGRSFNIKVTLDPSGTGDGKIELFDGVALLGSDSGAKTDYEIVSTTPNTGTRLTIKITAGQVQQNWDMTNFEVYEVP